MAGNIPGPAAARILKEPNAAGEAEASCVTAEWSQGMGGRETTRKARARMAWEHLGSPQAAQPRENSTNTPRSRGVVVEVKNKGSRMGTRPIQGRSRQGEQLRSVWKRD